MMTIKTGLSGLRLTPIFFLSLLFALGGCTPIQYHEIQPASAELKTLKYYRWDGTPLPAKAGPRALEFDASFKSTVEADLAKKGYILAPDKAEILVDYRISVATTPPVDDLYYTPHWIGDNRGTFVYAGWEDPRGTGDMLKHGVVTLSMRSVKSTKLLWEGGVSKLMRSDETEIDMGEAAKIAANAINKKTPSH